MYSKIVTNFILMFFLCGISYAEITVEIVKKNKNYEVRSSFITSAGMDTAWGVLSGYEKFPNYISSVKQCKIIEKKDNYILLDQKGSESVLYLFSVNINLNLKVREEKDIIYFEDILKTSFDVYKGHWEIKKLGSATQVTNFLEAKPAFYVPAFIAKEYMKAKARRYCEEILSEINRQAQIIK